MSESLNRPYCFIDFDGTLVDNKRRMYRFCCDYCCDSFESVMTVDEYWVLKRLGVNELDVVNAVLGTDRDKREYGAIKLAHMEDERYLEMDELISGSMNALSILSQLYRLVLVTRREHPNRLRREVRRLGVEQYFESLVIIPHDRQTKATAIRDRFNFDCDSLIVGDTEDDIAAGVELGINCAFVLSGIRSIAWREKFAGQAPIRTYGSLIDLARDLPLVDDAVDGIG